MLFREFRDFVLRGNVVQLAVAFIMGAAFNGVVRSFADDILTPPIGLLFGDVDFSEFFLVLNEGVPAGPYRTVAEAKAAGAATLNYGLFLTSIISFVITAAALFFLIRLIIRLQKIREAEPTTPEPTTKKCPHCVSVINVNATRCAFCTAQLQP